MHEWQLLRAPHVAALSAPLLPPRHSCAIQERRPAAAGAPSRRPQSSHALAPTGAPQTPSPHPPSAQRALPAPVTPAQQQHRQPPPTMPRELRGLEALKVQFTVDLHPSKLANAKRGVHAFLRAMLLR